MLLAVAGLSLGWLVKAPCVQTYPSLGGVSTLKNWADYRQYTLYCYSDTIPLYGADRLDQGGLPYKTSWKDPSTGQNRYMEYPVVTGMLQYGVALATNAWQRITRAPDIPIYPRPPKVVVYFTIMAAVLGVAWLAAVALTLPLAARPQHLVLMTLSPLLVVHAFTNFDALAVALMAAGLFAWARNRPWLAGVMLGVGGAAKLYPLLLIGPLLVLCWRTGQLRTWRRTALATALAWVLVNAPFAVLFPDGWREFFRLNSTRPADHDSVYNAISVLTHWPGFDGPLYYGQTPVKLNLISLGLLAGLCAGIGLIAVLAPRRPRVASLAFLVVAAFLLTNKVWSPQYSLWLVPLAVLALPRWLPLIAWMSLDAYLWVVRMGYFLNLTDPARGNSPETFVRVVLIRDALVAIICGWIIWTIFRPGDDPVRATGADDPAGGVLDHAADRGPHVQIPSAITAARGRWRSRESRRAPTAPGREFVPRSTS